MQSLRKRDLELLLPEAREIRQNGECLTTKSSLSYASVASQQPMAGYAPA